MGDLWVLVATAGIIAASAFFVAVEFAVVASRRTRLEERAGRSRAARAALRNSSEVSIMLAGCQLGITACTLALGAVTKPAVERLLAPGLDAAGLPTWLAGAAAFALALLLVTFLHLVVGEMAPKSWAITRPEAAATMFSLPMRGFMWFFRPLLRGINEVANALVRRSGVEPVDEVAMEQNPDDLRQLVRHSARAGTLDQGSSAQVAAVLDLTRLTVADLDTVAVVARLPRGASVAEAQREAQRTGEVRLLVGDPGEPEGVVHLADLVGRDPGLPVSRWERPYLRLTPSTTLLDALTRMRRSRRQVAVVVRRGEVPEVVTMADILRRIFPVGAASGTSPTD